MQVCLTQCVMVLLQSSDDLSILKELEMIKESLRIDKSSCLNKGPLR